MQITCIFMHRSIQVNTLKNYWKDKKIMLILLGIKKCKVGNVPVFFRSLIIIVNEFIRCHCHVVIIVCFPSKQFCFEGCAFLVNACALVHPGNACQVN